jgi:hypothetical protein
MGLGFGGLAAGSLGFCQCPLALSRLGYGFISGRALLGFVLLLAAGSRAIVSLGLKASLCCIFYYLIYNLLYYLCEVAQRQRTV